MATDPSSRPRSAREVAERAAALLPGRAAQAALPAEILTSLRAAGSTAAESVTLIDAGDVTSHGETAFPEPPAALYLRRKLRSRAAWLAAAAALVAAGLGGWRVGHIDASGPPVAVAPRPATSPSAPTVALNSAALVGLPVSSVLARLEQLGLQPIVVEVVTSAATPGTVLSVQPGGALAQGTVVTVTVAAAPASENPGRDGGSGDGGGGTDGGH